ESPAGIYSASQPCPESECCCNRQRQEHAALLGCGAVGVPQQVNGNKHSSRNDSDYISNARFASARQSCLLESTSTSHFVGGISPSVAHPIMQPWSPKRRV